MKNTKIVDDAREIIDEIGFTELRSASFLSDNIINEIGNQFDLNNIEEYGSMMCVALSFVLIKMCRFYYMSIGIILGIISSLLFIYFMG